MSEKDVLLEALSKLYEDMENSDRLGHLKKQYDSVAKGKSVGQFEKGMLEYKQKILQVKQSIETGKEVDTNQKKGFVCAALEGLEAQTLHSFRILKIANPEAICEEFTEKLSHIDALRKKFCDMQSPMVDDVIEKIT